MILQSNHVTGATKTLFLINHSKQEAQLL